MKHEEILSSISAMNLRSLNKFDHKLDFDQRCEVLALYRTGVPRAILAEAYGIDRRTVTHIYNPGSKHYKMVREEERKLGREEFQRKYLTENALAKLSALEPKLAKRREKAAAEPPPQYKANRSSSNRSGVQFIITADGKERRFLIEWQEKSVDNNGAGWYYRDLDGPDPTPWFDNGDESRVSSAACYEAIRTNFVEI